MPRSLAWLFSGIFLAALAARLGHIKVLWVDEAYPMAAAIQFLQGKLLYRDIWFDKPPLYAWIYLFWGALPGWPLRVAGALFATLCSYFAYLAARRLHGESEGRAAAALMAFFLIFDFPAAIMPLAPDLLSVPFALGCVFLARGRRPFAAGLAAGAAVFVNAKAVYLIPVAALFAGAGWMRVAAGSLVSTAAAAAVLALPGSLDEFWRQVWSWGFLYTRDTFVDSPLAEGLKRTLNWAGFHVALAVPAALYWWKERARDARMLSAWALLALASAIAGFRFFPRYYFALLPVLTVAAAKGVTMLPPRWGRCLLGAMLLLPAVRFGPLHIRIAAGALAGRPSQVSDLAMFEDCRAAAGLLRQQAHAGDTLFVWGYRPELNALARMPAGTRFLDSQPLTGVLADRHLTRSDVTAPLVAAQNRAELARTAPTFVVDGLAAYNPRLAIGQFPDLAVWFSMYEKIGETAGTRIYRRR
jgi:hypothetical protein